jgi:acyl-CoA synthetase (AMP-forming)/AMP-acid ligase II
VVAFVTLRRAASLDPATTRRRLRLKLADYAVPERFVVVDDLPRTAAGKLDRPALRRAAAHTDTGSPHGVAHT